MKKLTQNTVIEFKKFIDIKFIDNVYVNSQTNEINGEIGHGVITKYKKRVYTNCSLVYNIETDKYFFDYYTDEIYLSHTEMKKHIDIDKYKTILKINQYAYVNSDYSLENIFEYIERNKESERKQRLNHIAYEKQMLQIKNDMIQGKIQKEYI